MAFTDPVYKKPVISNTAPKVDARTLGIGNDNVAAAATDRRNQFNEVDLTQVPQASERTLNQSQGDVGMRTHAVENMQASKSIGRGPLDATQWFRHQRRRHSEGWCQRQDLRRPSIRWCVLETVLSHEKIRDY